MCSLALQSSSSTFQIVESQPLTARGFRINTLNLTPLSGILYVKSTGEGWETKSDSIPRRSGLE
jgi:hypothetical protein